MSFIVSAIAALIAFLVAANSKNFATEKNSQTVRAIAVLIGILATLLSLYQAIFRVLVIIPAGEVGMVEVFGQVGEQPLNPGIHFINPFASVVEFSTRLKDIKETVSATSKEGLNFELDVSLQYRVAPEKIKEIFSMIDGLCFVGHTHNPGIITEEAKFINPQEVNHVFRYDPKKKYIVNIKKPEWILYGEWLAAPRDFKIFNNQRIVVQAIRNPSLKERIIAAFVDEKLVARINVYTLLLKNETNLNYNHVLGILNSKLMNWGF
ncbi:MAG: hypothetical protein HC820_06775 [Hydrococcus sp. RM1_1_31]|nr:hypothetical protein [Hydrococcus sp. RM1_1_31]